MKRGALHAAVVVTCSVWLFAAPVVGAATTADATALGDVAVCDSVGSEETVVVGTVASSEEPLRGEQTLYAGTVLTIRLCDGGDVVTPYGEDGAWTLAAGDGYELRDAADDGVTIRLTEGYGRVAVAERVRPTEKADSGLVVTEPAANTVEPTFGTDGTLYLSTAEDVGTYQEREDAFRSEANDTEDAAATLSELSDAVRSDGLTADRVATAEETLRTLGEASNATESEGNDYRTYLFEMATESPTPGVAVAAMDGSRERERTVQDDADAAVAEYDSALDGRATTLQSTIRTNLLVGLFGGVLFGVALGGVVPYLAASNTAGRIRVDSSAEYSRYAQWLPVGAGVVVLLATLVALYATGGLAIFKVIL